MYVHGHSDDMNHCPALCALLSMKCLQGKQPLPSITVTPAVVRDPSKRKCHASQLVTAPWHVQDNDLISWQGLRQG